MSRFEDYVEKTFPDLVLVYGDVNSTLGVALDCAKMGIAVAHVEAGLRSFDRTMPEEINRVLTDQIADLLFTPSQDANENLCREGIPSRRVYLVGNVMIDTLVRLLPRAKAPVDLDLPKQYALVTLHRPSNVDNPETLGRILDSLERINHRIEVVFAVHPRTKRRLDDLGREARSKYGAMRILPPQGYLEFLGLLRDASVVITDSGGIQEETTFLNVPCLTLRDTTERPITISQGTNTLIGDDLRQLELEVDRVLQGCAKTGGRPPLWDGQASMRIASVLCQGLGI